MKARDYTAERPPTSEEEPQGAGIISECATIPELSRGGSNQNAEHGHLYGRVVRAFRLTGEIAIFQQ
jgi:hypothetical protein